MRSSKKLWHANVFEEGIPKVLLGTPDPIYVLVVWSTLEREIFTL